MRMLNLATAVGILCLPFTSTASSPERIALPSANDVTMRTLIFRDVPLGHLHDSLTAIGEFHATRLEWVYLSFTEEDREKVAALQDLGIVFGAAGGPQLANCLGADGLALTGSRTDLAILDLDGNPVVLPHQRKWATLPLIGDPSNPEYLQGHADFYKKCIDFGASAIQRDDPGGAAFAAVKYGGGFTQTGVEGFRFWLQQNLSAQELVTLGVKDIENFDYAAYLREKNAPVGDAFAAFYDSLKPYWERYWYETTAEFYETLIADVREYAQRPIAFSCNNTSLQIWDIINRKFDFAISELLLGSAHPQHIWNRSRKAHSLGKVQVFGSPKTRGTEVVMEEKEVLTRKVIATAYATGSLSRVPWDIFQQTDDGLGRYFGAPETYADLYGFVRAQDWNGLSEFAAYGHDIDAKAAKDAPFELEVLGGSQGVYAFVRGDESNAERPVFIHLVDWGLPLVPKPEQLDSLQSIGSDKIYFSVNGEENLKRSQPQPFQLKLGELPRGNASFVLLEPKPYDAVLHAAAEESGDYSSLIERTKLDAEWDGANFIDSTEKLLPRFPLVNQPCGESPISIVR